MSNPLSPYEQMGAFAGVIDILNAVDAQYAIWGGLAILVFGEPRFTQDMDILLKLDPRTARLMIKRLKEMHYHIDEIQVNHCLLGGFFNAIHLPTMVKIDFWIPEFDPVLDKALRDRVFLPFDDIRQAAYLSAESLIITKLKAFKSRESTRDLDDIASILRIQGTRIQTKEIEVVAHQLNLWAVWRTLVAQNNL